MENQNIIKIKKISKRLKIFSKIMILLTPILVISYWLVYNILPEYLRFSYENIVSQDKILPLSVLLVCIFISLIPTGIFIFLNKILINMSNLYESGKYFTSQNILHFKRLGKLAVIWAFLDIVIRTTLTVVITLGNPPGQRILKIEIGSFQLSSLIMGTIIILVSHVMEEARIINDEHQYTV